MSTEQLKLPSYGGQALIEGVLMRGSRYISAAMRTPEGNITTVTEHLTGIYKSSLTHLPFLRGLVILWDSLGIGMRFLTISANTQTGEDEKIEGAPLVGTLLFSMAFAVAIFFLLPAAAGKGLTTLLKINPWWASAIEGVIRLVFLIVYMWAIGKLKDIERVFGYHGAEHKTINAFEAGAELTPAVVKNYSVEHPRCGTAFMLTLVVFSILIFSLIGPLPAIWLVVSRIALLPVIAMFAYEYIRWTANHLDSPFVSILSRPNLALQHLTTREPSPEMLEVAIKAFQEMYAHEQSTDQPVVI
jgi:uncharacterized protein YqhQ